MTAGSASRSAKWEEETMAGMLEGKSALVTGGGGGIGRAAALPPSMA
jgi:FlaA1/EpsC-like NDP-sugar epimerase